MSSKRSITERPPSPTASDAKPASRPARSDSAQRTIRETIESIIVAFVLAFLFRTFEAEAFVIPTGSMAPTLQGRHKDLICPECGTEYRVGASSEVDEDGRRDVPKWEEELKDPTLTRQERDHLLSLIHGNEVVRGTCPNCRFPMSTDPESAEGRKWPAYNGDRILVAKFPYDFAEPKRWDVVVFRFPGNGQMNFIKRLVGLPRETVKIEQGDIYVKPAGEDQFDLVHKPAAKVWAMSQAVYDNDYVVDSMTAAGWPLRWQPMESNGSDGWASNDGGRSYEIAGGDSEHWIRYQHFTPDDGDWREMEVHGHVTRPPLPRLITDFYAYNTGVQRRGLHDGSPVGFHWVGDLMLEATLDVQKEQGSVVLDLVKGGRHFQCHLDLQSGQATLAIDGLPDFAPTARTSVRGVGQYRVAWANVDRQLLLWIDGRLIEFSSPATYEDLGNELPTVDDLAPAGIAARGADVKTEHLLLKRDVYYIAANASENGDYDFPGAPWGPDKFAEFFTMPKRWSSTSLFSWRRSAEFLLEADQFFMLGDNSPQSKDSRVWADSSNPEYYVRRELLIGQALFIYWPASHNKIPYLNIPFPLFPNFKQMGFVR
ncbi:MAG TPA: signal peptidase I [Pirellulales bacterium]|jgi:signal peptidase I|nr:signal peptidase I [Pirellulales bacterium]